MVMAEDDQIRQILPRIGFVIIQERVAISIDAFKSYNDLLALNRKDSISLSKSFGRMTVLITSRACCDTGIISSTYTNIPIYQYTNIYIYIYSQYCSLSHLDAGCIHTSRLAVNDLKYISSNFLALKALNDSSADFKPYSALVVMNTLPTRSIDPGTMENYVYLLAIYFHDWES